MIKQQEVPGSATEMQQCSKNDEETGRAAG
jgi:hypothetical protein